MATIEVPVAPAIFPAVLTDYARWPKLLEVRMRLMNVEWRDGRTVTDLRIRHALLPGERRLLCESRALPNGGVDHHGGLRFQTGPAYLATYAGRGRQPDTRGLRADLETDMVVPDWLLAVSLCRELEAHFSLVREQAIERAAQGR